MGIDGSSRKANPQLKYAKKQADNLFSPYKEEKRTDISDLYVECN